MDEPVYISDEAYQDLSAGINPVSKTELIEAIKRGKIYTVRHDGVAYQIVADKTGNLLLKDE